MFLRRKKCWLARMQNLRKNSLKKRMELWHYKLKMLLVLWKIGEKDKGEKDHECYEERL